MKYKSKTDVDQVALLKLLPMMLTGSWRYVYALFALILFTAIMEGVGLSLIIPLTQTMVTPSAASGGGNAIQRVLSHISMLFPEKWQLTGLLGLLTFVFLIKSIGLVASSGLSRWFVDILRAKWVADVFLSYTRIPYSAVSVRPHGEIVQNIVGETEIAARTILLLIEYAARILQMLVLLLLMFLASAEATLFVLLLGLLGFGLSWRSTKLFSLDNGLKKQTLRLESNDLVSEGITGLRTLKLLDIAETRAKRLRKILRQFARLNTKFGVISELPSNTTDLVAVIMGAAVIIFMTIGLGMESRDAVPTMALFAVVFLRIAGSASFLFSKRLQIASSLPSLSSVYALLSAAPEQVPGSEPFPGIKGDIVFEDLMLRPPGRQTIFDGLRMTIPPLGLTAIVGPSGSGKTTLVDLIVRLREPDGGRILIDGRNIRDFDVRSLRKRVGYLSQDPQLFNGTVAENMRLGRVDATDDEMRRAAERAHVHDFVSAMPLGYDTPLGRGAVTLSGGQRQRLALARELLRDPDLYIFDEPTSALDHEAEAVIGELVNQLSKTHPVVIISHRPDVIFGANVIYRIEDGKAVQAILPVMMESSASAD